MASGTCSVDCAALMSTMGASMKAGLCQMPAVYRDWYTTCPPPCGAVDKLSLLVVAFCAHVWINIIAYLVGTLIWLATFGTLSIGSDIFNFILTILSLWWLLTITHFGDTCCLPQWVNALIFTIVVVWFTVAAVIGAVGYITFINAYPALTIPMLLYFWDLSILLPLAHYSVLSTLWIRAQAMVDATVVVKAADPLLPGAPSENV